MNKKILFFITSLLFTVSIANSASAKEELLRIDVHEFPPMVIVTDGKIIGHDIDLFDAVADDIGLEKGKDYYYNSVNKFSEVFDNLIDQSADAALAGITITSEREKNGVDFSHPYMYTGLGIMINSANESDNTLSYISSFITPGLKKILIIIFIFIILAGHVAWYSQKGKKSINDKYIPGIFDAMWWVIVTISTVGYGDIVPEDWKGRLVGSFLILLGLALFGLYIGEVSSAMTIQKMEYSILGPEDLNGKKVTTIDGTTSVPALKQIGAKIVKCENIDKAVDLLKINKVKAVVFDEISLKYYIKNDISKNLIVIDKIFDTQYYGIAFPDGSSLREQVNRSLLKIQKNGVYEKIHKKWFSI